MTKLSFASALVALLAHSALAGETVPACVDALEQVAALKTALPVYKLKNSRDPPDVIAAQRQRVANTCPAVPTVSVWLVAPSFR
jgi:hypothetical protein